MAAFAVFAPGRSRNFDLFAVYGDQLEIGADNEEVEFAARSLTASGFQNNSCFECVGGGDEPCTVLDDQIEKMLALGLGPGKWRPGPRYRSPSARRPVLVIAEDFVFRSRVECGKGIHPMQHIFKLTR
jgi:hypothetical protein